MSENITKEHVEIFFDDSTIFVAKEPDEAYLQFVAFCDRKQVPDAERMPVESFFEFHLGLLCDHGLEESTALNEGEEIVIVGTEEDEEGEECKGYFDAKIEKIDAAQPVAGGIEGYDPYTAYSQFGGGGGYSSAFAEKQYPQYPLDGGTVDPSYGEYSAFPYSSSDAAYYGFSNAVGPTSASASYVDPYYDYLQLEQYLMQQQQLEQYQQQQQLQYQQQQQQQQYQQQQQRLQHNAPSEIPQQTQWCRNGSTCPGLLNRQCPLRHF